MTSKELISLLDLEQLDLNLYRGGNFKTPWGRVFGGQVLAQSLHASTETIPSERHLHSLHAYFILTGDVNLPIIYDVETIRDGGSFNTRRVTARQKGRPIFVMSASYHKEKEGLVHQSTMPDVPKPDDLSTDEEMLSPLKETNPIAYQAIVYPRPIEFRPVERYDILQPQAMKPIRHVWMKSKEPLPDEPSVHQEILTYATDYNLLTTALFPHLDKGVIGTYFLASLDHVLWFHRDFRVDEWLLYCLDSPSASGSRGFTRGQIFNQQGELVASVAQEGLMAPIRM